jgi:serine/threonine-protein kinase
LGSIKGYKLIRKLGRGGMGEVHLARHEQTGQQVALKVMLPQVAVDPRAKDIFLREADVTAAMNHENIVKLHDSGYSGGTFFFTMEFCDGGSAQDLMAKRGGRLPVDEACRIVLQALDGLDYAHNVKLSVKLRNGRSEDVHGVVHRDVKPANIFLCGSGRSATAKLADFGLGKAFDTAGFSGRTRTGTTAGSPWFMPRQQVVNFKYSKPEVDVWGMAASLYHMLCGARKLPPGVFPREFPPGREVWKVVLDTNAVSIRRHNPSIPKKLADVIDAALVDSPAIRFKSAAEFKRMLEGAL